MTPAFHRVHHSVHEKEQQSNYSFSVPWWDMFFGTYIPAKRIDDFGLKGEAEPDFIGQLKAPFLFIKKMKKIW